MDYRVQQRDVEFLLDDVFDVQSAWQQIEATRINARWCRIVAEGGRVAAGNGAVKWSGDAKAVVARWSSPTPSGFASAFSG